MIHRLVVVGSGVMGRGIAYVAAVGGYEITLVDTNESALKNAEKELNNIFQKGLDRGKITADQVELAQRKLHFETNLIVAVKTADLIIEAVPEIASIKRSL